jgi:hypothetical protein
MSHATPVFITVRDRLRDLRRLVEWLERAGLLARRARLLRGLDRCWRTTGRLYERRQR